MVIRGRHIVWCVLLLVSAAHCLLADSISTPASSAALALAGGLEAFQKDHDGKIPQRWSELDGKYVAMRIVEARLGGPVGEKFVLIANSSVQMVSSNPSENFYEGTIIAVISSAVSEDRRRDIGRYVIWKDNLGRFRTSWLAESVVLAQFKEAGFNLPTGPLEVQPSTLDASPDYARREYAEENFKDPKNPTSEELAKMKRDFAERYSDKRPATPSSTVSISTSTPQLAPLSASRASANSTETVAEETPESVGFPIMLGVTLVVIFGALAVYLLKRKNS